ncbi:MAG: hypothetical protein KDE26_20760 [Bacteroidetes bacterium]|nr:hypothetical protein [Bacteroidota bacterium]
MIKKEAYHLQCAKCKEEFPIVVTIDTDKKEQDSVNSREVTCPFCETLLTFEIDRSIALNDVIIKTIKKA